MNMASKRCNKCREVKDFTEFHRNKGHDDGLTTYCKPCRNKIARDNPIIYKEGVCVKCKGYKQIHARQMCNGCYRRNIVYVDIKKKNRFDEKRRIYYKKNQDDMKGRQKARNLIKDLKYCNRCNSKQDLHRHHKDFNPQNNDISNIEIVCRNCHVYEHNLAKQIGSQMFRRSKW